MHLIQDWLLVSRFSKIWPYLFLNYALDPFHPRPRKLSYDMAIDRILFNFEGI